MKLAPPRRACVSEPASTIATIVELLLGEDLRALRTTRVGSFAGFHDHNLVCPQNPFTG